MPRATSYPQTTLLPPEAVEAVLRLGVVGAGNHVQVQVDIHDATDGTLLASWSRPHAPVAALDAVAAEGLAELLAGLRQQISPF